MSLVKAKKHLGQHFLTDKNIAEKIGVYAGDLEPIIKSLLDHKLLEVVDL